MSVPTSNLTLEKCSSSESTLDQLLSLLFEPTATLHDLLTPAVFERIQAGPGPKTYEDIIGDCELVGISWEWDQKAQFVHGHPKIGAPKVTGLSGKEQGSPTSQVVLDR
jgi:hypothetical protein